MQTVERSKIIDDIRNSAQVLNKLLIKFSIYFTQSEICQIRVRNRLNHRASALFSDLKWKHNRSVYHVKPHGTLLCGISCSNKHVNYFKSDSEIIPRRILCSEFAYASIWVYLEWSESKSFQHSFKSIISYLKYVLSISNPNKYFLTIDIRNNSKFVYFMGLDWINFNVYSSELFLKLCFTQ